MVMVAYKRQQSIKDKIAQFPPEIIRNKRILPGMKKCGNCVVCQYVKECNQVLTKTNSWNHLSVLQRTYFIL